MEREFRYTSADFNRVREVLLQLTGIKLADSKDSLVYSRLVPRIRLLKLNEMRQYVDYLATHPEEEEHFINCLTTNLTSFFREPHHFEILSDFIASGEKVDSIWCTASSTGEEPYSIAMALVQHYQSFDIPTRVLASDIDSRVLSKAALGVYPLDKVVGLANKENFFLRGKGKHLGQARVVPALRDLISFQRINLLDQHYPEATKSDVIFCRNVMIYFDKDHQGEILTRLLAKLRPGGLYIAGHSENFSQYGHLMKPIGRTAYIKV